MASNFADMAAGLATVLRNNITGATVAEYPADSVGGMPFFVVLPERVDYLLQIGGNTFEARFRVVVLLASGDDASGFIQLYDYIDPTFAGKGFRQAVDADRTLNGKADSSQVEYIENIGRRELFGGWYFGFDAIVTAIKSVA